MIGKKCNLPVSAGLLSFLSSLDVALLAALAELSITASSIAHVTDSRSNLILSFEYCFLWIYRLFKFFKINQFWVYFLNLD